MQRDDDEQAVARGLRAGDRSAWAALYDGYSTVVWRYVARLVGADATAVADVVQEAFLGAARAASTFDAERGSLRAWLLGIAHRQVALYWRNRERADRWRRLAESGAVEVRQWLDDGDGPSQLWERAETSDLVRGVLAELPPEQAALLVAKYVDQSSLEELARRYDRSVEAMKSKLARARRDFRAQFEQRSGIDRTAPSS